RLPCPPSPTLFPYTTLFRSLAQPAPGDDVARTLVQRLQRPLQRLRLLPPPIVLLGYPGRVRLVALQIGCRGTYHAVLVVLVQARSEDHTSELQSRENLVCRL